MTSRKITIDNSVKYVSRDSNSQSEQTKGGDIKPETMKKIHFLGNKTKIIQKTKKND